MRILTAVCSIAILLSMNSDLVAQKKRKRDQMGDPAQLFQRLDKNQDGQLTEDEVPERMVRGLARMDNDENGTIDSEEFGKFIKRRNQMNQNGSRNEKGKSKGKRREGMDGDQKKMRDGKMRDGKAGGDQAISRRGMDRLMKRIDKNDDKVITRDELPPRMQESWAEIDLDGNDKLEGAELTAFVKKIMVDRGGNRGDGQAKKKMREGRDDEPKSRGGVKPKRPGSGS